MLLIQVKSFSVVLVFCKNRIIQRASFVRFCVWGTLHFCMMMMNIMGIGDGRYKIYKVSSNGVVWCYIKISFSLFFCIMKYRSKGGALSTKMMKMKVNLSMLKIYEIYADKRSFVNTFNRHTQSNVCERDSFK